MVAQFIVCTPWRKSSISSRRHLDLVALVDPVPEGLLVRLPWLESTPRFGLVLGVMEAAAAARKALVSARLAAAMSRVVVAGEGLELARAELGDDRGGDVVGLHPARRAERRVVAVARERELRAAGPGHEQLRVDAGAEQVEVERLGVQLERALRRRVRTDPRRDRVRAHRRQVHDPAAVAIEHPRQHARAPARPARRS